VAHGSQKLNLGCDGKACPTVNMDTLTLINPLVFLFGVVISFLFRNNIFIHIEKEARERKKMMEIMDAKLRKLRSDFEEVVDASEEAASQAEDELKEQEDAEANMREAAEARLAILQTNIEEMKDVIGRMNTDYVSERDLRRAIEGFVIYGELKEMLTPFVLRSEVEDFVTSEKAANMVFQSEAIQRRRLEAVRKTLEALILHAEQQETDAVTQADLATFVTRSEMVTYVGREELVGYVGREEMDALSARTLQDTRELNEKLKAIETASPPAKEPEYYQGWMASAELNGIKAEVEICNIQLRTKAENKAWLEEDGALGAVQNRDSWLETYREGYAVWKQNVANPNEYVYRTYKSGEWSTGVKTEMKLTFPTPPAPSGGLPPPPPRNGSVCAEVFTKLMPLLAWERVLLAAETV
jgi:hypothetical protein